MEHTIKLPKDICFNNSPNHYELPGEIVGCTHIAEESNEEEYHEVNAVLGYYENGLFVEKYWINYYDEDYFYIDLDKLTTENKWT